MGNWQDEIDIKQFIKKDNNKNYPVSKMLKELVKYLRTDKVAKEVIPKRFANSFENVIGKENEDERINRILERLYDYADYNRIWLGI